MINIKRGRVPRGQVAAQILLKFCGFFIAAIIFSSFNAYGLDLPEGVKDYYKDNVSSAPGKSEGVGPTQKAQTKQGVDIGRRETKEYDFSDESATALTAKAWEALNNKNKGGVAAYTSKCITLYEDKAKDQEALLDDFAPSGSEAKYEYLNSVAACYFIRGELYKHFKDWKEAKAAYKKVVNNFFFAQYWDPRGWWWKPADISKGEIEKIDTGYYEKNE